MERKDGYYWVRMDKQPTWVIAEWTNGNFWLTGNDEAYHPTDFAEIGAKIERS